MLNKPEAQLGLHSAPGPARTLAQQSQDRGGSRVGEGIGTLEFHRR
jgi:hypothetical protein